MASYSNSSCVYTPFTGTVCPSTFPVSPVDEVDKKVNGEIKFVNGILGTLTTLSASVGGLAEQAISELASYSSPALPSIVYSAPRWTDPTQHAAPASTLAVVKTPDAGSAIAWVTPTFNDVAEPTADITAPSQELPEIPSAAGVSVPGTGPASPSAYVPTVAAAPSITIPTVNLGTLESPLLDTVTFSLPGELVLDTFSLTLDYTPLTKALDILKNLSVPSSTVPDYTLLFDDIFTVVGGLVSGVSINTDAVILDKATPRPVATSLAKRGIAPVAAVHSYDSWLASVLRDYADDSAVLFTHAFTDEVIRSSLKIATKAETLLIDIAVGINDARFKHSVAMAEASLEVATGIVAYYNGLVAELEGRVLTHNSELARLRALADAAKADASLVKGTGEANRAIGQAFAAGERSKTISARVFAATIDGEAAKLEGMRGKIAELEGALAQAQAGLLSYIGEAVRYSGETARVSGVYNQYRAHATAVTEQNRAREAKARSSTAELRSIGAEASAAAARVGVMSAQLNREALAAQGEYAASASFNDVAAYRVAKQLQDFALDSAAARNEVATAEIAPAAVADIGQAISRFSRTAMESAGRAADLAQRANDTLARAYATAYEVAGRAGAAVQTGKLSGFRASASLSAAGDLSASESRRESDSSSGSVQYEESLIATQSLSA